MWVLGYQFVGRGIGVCGGVVRTSVGWSAVDWSVTSVCGVAVNWMECC